MSKKYTPTPHANEMFLFIQKYLSSQLSRIEFCRQQGIRYSTLQWWLTKYRQINGISKQHTPSQQKFIPIELKTSAGRDQAQYRIEYPNGVVLHVSGQFDVQLILKLITIN